VRYASQYIYVLGEVGRPGKYLTAGKELTLRDAIVLAGLPGHYAAIHRVYVITPCVNRSGVSQKVIDLDRVLNRGELTRDVRLNAGDIVYVPQTFWGHIATLISDLMSPVSSIPVARSAIAGVP